MTTSSTSSTFCPGSSRKPRRSSKTPCGRSTNSASTPSARPISWPMITPPIAGETTMSIRDRSSRGIEAASAPARRDGAHRIHQHPRALQVARAVQARGQDEMALEQRAGGAEFGQDFLFGHRFSRLCGKAGTIGNRRHGFKRSASRRTCLRDANPLPIRRAQAPPGAQIQPPARADHRGLDEDLFEAFRHRRRLRDGARRGPRRSRARPGHGAPRRRRSAPAASAHGRQPAPPRRRAGRRRRRATAPTARHRPARPSGSACSRR